MFFPDDGLTACCVLNSRNAPKTSESVEKLDAEQILFAVTIPCRAIGNAGRESDDDGTAETD